MDIRERFTAEEIKLIERVRVNRPMYDLFMSKVAWLFFVMTVVFWAMAILIVAKYEIRDFWQVVGFQCKPREMYPGSLTLLKEFMLLGCITLGLGVWFYLDKQTAKRDRLILKSWELLKEQSKPEVTSESEDNH